MSQELPGATAVVVVTDVTDVGDRQLVHSELQLALADALRRSSTRAEHIRLVRISSLVDRLVAAS